MSYVGLKPILFFVFLSGALGFFARSVWRLIRLARLGKDTGYPIKDPVERIGKVIYYAFFQKKVVDERFGWNHVVFFWSFVIISIGHLEFIVRGVIPSFSLHFLGQPVYSTILRGQDIMAFVVLFAVVTAVFRRVVLRPTHIHALSADAFRILGLITFVMVSYFLATGFGLAGGHPDVASYAPWLPVSGFVAHFLGSANVGGGGGVNVGYEIFWWLHAVILLTFLNYLPFSKHIHLLGAIPNIFLHKRDKPRSALSTIDFETAEVYGVGKVTDFTWKALVDTYACTECGRCDLYCPANNTKKPLRPQQVIHDIKDNLMANGDPLLAKRTIFQLLRAEDDFEPDLPLIAESEETRQKGQTSKDVLWSCTACGACVEACPVLIDHVDAIMDMRRYLTLTEGSVSAELATTFKNIENNYNPWGIGADKRADWAEGLNMRFWGASDDAKQYEYLFWVGCAGSFDARAQKVVRAFTQILDQAAVTYAILGEKEKCTGDPARRTGNEYMFDDLARQNVETLNSLGVKKVVTACPHCFNTLKNEYQAFGGHYEVIHHSQLIAELIADERIGLDEETMKRVVFHDPCYLGRWNGEFEAPRRSIAAVRRLEVVEMDATQEKSFCCGAGGGQMWMEEKLGDRVNNVRTAQALEKKPDIIGVACPFCMTMLEDGVKHHHKEEDVKVLDVAEIVALAMKRKAPADVASTAASTVGEAKGSTGPSSVV
ncbi:MAG: (Fe-S)-binding protein [Deltaproteobacteria bacterium]|nr:(Fe-S)-binding protein [Deltaproteobacteria bacterium]